MNLDLADKIASDVLNRLKPLCHRIEVTGRVRRRKPSDIKDVELLAIPDTTDINRLAELKKMVNSAWGPPRHGAFPSRCTEIKGSYEIKFWWVTKRTWAVSMFIHTGSTSFVSNAMDAWKKISQGGYFQEGMMHAKDGTPLDIMEEPEIFQHLRMQPIEPKMRFKLASTPPTQYKRREQ